MKSLLDEHLKRVKELQRENQLLKKLATNAGFITLYYEHLPNFNHNYECFNYLNDLHYKHFGEEKHASYDSFRVLKNNSFRK